ncbi:MAG TPA: hypothetical protein VI893_00645 [Thermoplasmata archaeon]|nr:hypothetical protein [Thermoplasmata archaeon]
MIRLERVRATQVIPTAFRGPGRLKSSRALVQLRIDGGAPDSAVWKKAKKQLKVESGGKCAYCEGKAAHLVHGDVEHFRPKDIYWWLAYCLDNYTFACQICNQTHKGAKFPVPGDVRLVAPDPSTATTPELIEALAAGFGVDPLDTTAVATFDALLASENAHLPDPYRIDPEPLFKWVADPFLKEVEIAAANNSPAAKLAHTTVTDVLGLNRPELKGFRYRWYRVATILARVVKDPGADPQNRTDAEDELRIMMSVEGEFAGMVRYVVRVIEGLPL